MDRRRLWLVGVGVVGIAVMIAVRFWLARADTPKPVTAPTPPSTPRSRLAPVLPEGSDRVEGSSVSRDQVARETVSRDQVARETVSRETITDTARIRDHRS
ncbi:MAG: hypothetical protein H0V17_13390, partial [Deltaproteobacteria bacterium]|nr:hypothetical protein [Deltaproteobacteria bacterium]